MKRLLWLFKYKWIERKCPNICLLCQWRKYCRPLTLYFDHIDVE